MTLNSGTQDHEKAMEYVSQWFWSMETLEAASGLSRAEVEAMIEAKCVPGIIYAYSENETHKGGNHNGWWSALGAYLKKDPALPPEGAQSWYSPAIVWWLRRSVVAMRSGLSVTEAAAKHREDFVQRFLSLLPHIQYSNMAYPECFMPEGHIETAQATIKAKSEWEAWIKGAYGVCLRDFTAETCITKEAIGTLIRLHNEDPHNHPLTEIELIELCQRLSTHLTPFAPWERPHGTPGKTIDVVLDRMQLGTDHPYPFGEAAVSFE